jgi:glycosyltransferase involved in cell wall biosynthesis
MRQIIFDCERMKYPNTGLYHYCLNLGLHLQDAIGESQEQLNYYLPPVYKNIFGSQYHTITQHSLHKFRLPNLQSYDIWHATFQNTDYLPQLNKKIKVVLSIHDLNFLYDEKKSPEKKQKYLLHLQKLINRADALICISDFSKKDVLQHCDTGNKPLYVIYNGTNSLNQPLLNSKSYKPQKPFLFSIGVVNRKKNFHVLLPLLQNDSMELLIAGRYDDESYISYIKNRSEEMGVSGNVRLLGQVTENEKAWYFNNCRAFALPSISEGFGLPVTEAMSYGKPLFLSDKTALPEIGGDVSFYFKNFQPDHIQTVFDNGMKKYNANGLRERIKARGANFCWQKAAKEYVNVYRSLY